MLHASCMGGVSLPEGSILYCMQAVGGVSLPGGAVFHPVLHARCGWGQPSRGLTLMTVLFSTANNIILNA